MRKRDASPAHTRQWFASRYDMRPYQYYSIPVFLLFITSGRAWSVIIDHRPPRYVQNIDCNRIRCNLLSPWTRLNTCEFINDFCNQIICNILIYNTCWVRARYFTRIKLITKTFARARHTVENLIDVRRNRLYLQNTNNRKLIALMSLKVNQLIRPKFKLTNALRYDS